MLILIFLPSLLLCETMRLIFFLLFLLFAKISSIFLLLLLLMYLPVIPILLLLLLVVSLMSLMLLSDVCKALLSHPLDAELWRYPMESSCSYWLAQLLILPDIDRLINITTKGHRVESHSQWVRLLLSQQQQRQQQLSSTGILRLPL